MTWPDGLDEERVATPDLPLGESPWDSPEWTRWSDSTAAHLLDFARNEDLVCLYRYEETLRFEGWSPETLLPADAADALAWHLNSIPKGGCGAFVVRGRVPLRWPREFPSRSWLTYLAAVYGDVEVVIQDPYRWVDTGRIAFVRIQGGITP